MKISLKLIFFLGVLTSINSVSAEYFIRNGVTREIFVFKNEISVDTQIGSLGGWSPQKLVIPDNSFPILICADNGTQWCTSNDPHITLSQGCYVIWEKNIFTGTLDSTGLDCASGEPIASSKKTAPKSQPIEKVPLLKKK